MEIAAKLIELEEGFWRASGDRARYASRLASDAVHVFPGWGVAEREAVLAGVADARPWSAFTIDEPRIVMLDDDAAALVYRTVAYRSSAAPYAAAVTSVYRRREGRWELVVHQQTALETEGG